MVEPRASRSDVARLFGRAAFGATAADLDRWAGQPYVAVVDFLVNVPDPATRMPAADDARRILLETSGASLALNQGWWLERMRTTTYPLEERVTLFLHDHFATATTGSGLPDAGMLLRQNQTLRSRSLGNFRTLAGEITIDPAMLHWLSGVSNTRGRPNENYGRELLELFTLGTKPQVYTETDIREAARALTGWTYNAVTRQLAFNANLHDTGSKSVLGRTITNQGALEYLAVVNAALAQPIAARWLAYKLVLNFGYVPDTTDLLTAPDPLVAAVADALGPNWDLRNAVRTLLLADGFRFADAAAGRQSVRQPIELAVHAAKALGFSADNTQLLARLGAMSQKPFQPPNVSGWPVGKNWLSPTTMIARYDLGLTAFNLWAGASVLATPLPASADLTGWTARLGLAALSPVTASGVNNYLTSAPASVPERERQTGVLALLMSSPDWMVM